MILRIEPVPVSRARHRCNLALIEDAEYSYVEPYGFRCQRCGQEWTADDLFSGFDVSTVTCSNCYSADVSMTKVKIVKVRPPDD